MKSKKNLLTFMMFVSFFALCFGQQAKTKTYKVKDVSFTMVYVEGGETVLGCTSEQGDKGKYIIDGLYIDPVSVTLDNFWIGQTEVTQELWEAVMGENPSQNKDNPKQPVTNVSWEECMVFITRLSGLTGERFRMPTEAEWEYAARGGMYSKYYKFSGSNDPTEVGWVQEIGAKDENGRPLLGKSPHVVGTKKPNELGIYDMTGNVSEWCKNGVSNVGLLQGGDNPQGRSGAEYRIYRGDSFRGIGVGVCQRHKFKPDARTQGIGLRLARSVKIKMEED